MIRGSKKLTLAAIYFTFFIDNLSWAIVFPIFAPYFLDAGNVLFSPDVSPATRSMILGFFLTAFSLGQLLGAPWIGEFADQHGRKKALGLAIFFTFLGIGASAWFMTANNLYGLFIARLVTGAFASSTSVCLSSISDLSENEGEKLKNFGHLSLAAGLAFVAGAFFGGKLADRGINPLFGESFPLWIASALAFLNFLFVLFAVRETVVQTERKKFCLFQGFQNIRLALKTKGLKEIYLIFFFFLFAWVVLFQFFPVLMVERFGFTSSNIGDMALFMGVCWAVGAGYLNKWALCRFPTKYILEFCLIGFAVLCTATLFFSQLYVLLGILGVCVVLGAVAWPICNSLVSNLSSQKIQGKALGMTQSIQSLAMTLGPAIAAPFFHISFSLPFLLSAVTCLVAIVLYYSLVKSS